MSVVASEVLGDLTQKDLAFFQSDFESSPANRQAMNAVCTTPVNKVALNRRKASKVESTFSVHLPESPVCNQKGSGRCWMFAALNTFRAKAAKALNLENFELSQNYTMFWDKLEKANYFLESILQTLDEPVGSRLLCWLLQTVITDGGQWDMFVNLINKYGVVPKTVMPETESSSSTGQMNFQITQMLRSYAVLLRKAAAAGMSVPELRDRKRAYMAEVYRMLCIHLGEPPESFEWQWRDKDKEFHRDGTLTPKEFYEKYVGIDMSELVCLIHDPRPGHEYNSLFTVRFLGNVVGGQPTIYINADLDTAKKAAISQIQDGEPVWFGCDVGQYLNSEAGVMDNQMFDYGLVYGVTPQMDKAERLEYCHSAMSHAMMFTGVDLDEQGEPRKWRVENSWGDERGEKGYFQMTDTWFDEFNYEVVVNKKYVPVETLQALSKEPTVLDPWDPMGSLAL